MTKRPEDLRSARWFAPDDLRSMGHRSRAMQMGLSDEDWDGKPVIAIINTWSDLSPCHHHLRDRAAFVKQGVYQAGGMPVEMPVHSFSEQFLKPTSMLYRNMGALEVEETLRSHPIDGAVLMGGVTSLHQRSSWGRSAPDCRSSSCRQGRCCAAIMLARSWVQAPMSGNIGMSAGPAP